MSSEQSSPLDSEASLANLLSQVLGDDSWWMKFAAVSDDEQWRVALADRALDLYGRTSPVIESRVTKEVAAIDYGIAILREIADSAAMRSCPVTLSVPIPTRAVIELEVRLYEVDDWAARLGWPIDLRESGVPEEAWPVEAGNPDLTSSDFVTEFLSAVEVYERVMEVRNSPGASEALGSDGAREGAWEMIHAARSWFVWSRGQVDSGVMTVAGAMVYMAQAVFIASRERTVHDTLFPTKEFLRTLLHGWGGHEWLVGHGSGLAEWLT